MPLNIILPLTVISLVILREPSTVTSLVTLREPSILTYPDTSSSNCGFSLFIPIFCSFVLTKRTGYSGLIIKLSYNVTVSVTFRLPSILTYPDTSSSNCGFAVLIPMFLFVELR